MLDGALRSGRLRFGNAEIYSRDDAGKALPDLPPGAVVGSVVGAVVGGVVGSIDGDVLCDGWVREWAAVGSGEPEPKHPERRAHAPTATAAVRTP